MFPTSFPELPPTEQDVFGGGAAVVRVALGRTVRHYRLPGHKPVWRGFIAPTSPRAAPAARPFSILLLVQQQTFYQLK